MKDPPGQTSLVTIEAVEEASRKLDKIGIDRPIKDELELEEFMPTHQEVEQDVTSDEEEAWHGPSGAGDGWGSDPPCSLFARAFHSPSLTVLDFARRDAGRLSDDDFPTMNWPRS